MGSYSASNTVQQLSVCTQTPAHRSADNLESFLISRNYTEGLIVLCSPWKWNMLHWDLMVKDIACRSYIIERSWMSNQWEKMQQKQQYTSPQNYTASSPLWASQERGTCVMWCTKVPKGGVHWQFFLFKSASLNCRSLSNYCFFLLCCLNRRLLAFRVPNPVFWTQSTTKLAGKECSFPFKIKNTSLDDMPVALFVLELEGLAAGRKNEFVVNEELWDESFLFPRPLYR